MRGGRSAGALPLGRRKARYELYHSVVHSTTNLETRCSRRRASRRWLAMRPPPPSRQRDLELLRLAFPDVDADVVHLVLDSCVGGEDVAAEAARQLALLADTAGPSQPAFPLGRFYRKSSNDDTGGGKIRQRDWKRERAVHRLLEAFPNLSIHFIANVYEDAGKDADNAATILASWQDARPLEVSLEGSQSGGHVDDPRLADEQSRRHLREENGTPSGSQIAGEVPAVTLHLGDEAPSTVPAKGATLAFLRSMLGPDAAIKDDIIMDVLDHFEGDALKSWEVLLNLSSSPATPLDHATSYSSPEQPQVVNALGSHNQATLQELQRAFPSNPPKLLDEVLTTSWGSYRIAYRTLCSFGLEPALAWTSDSKLTAAFPTLSEAARGYNDISTQAESKEHSNDEKRQGDRYLRPLTYDLQKSSRNAGDNQEWRPVEEAGQLRNYCYQEARRAWSRGKKLQAQSLMEMGHMYKEKMCNVTGSQAMNCSLERNSTSKQVLNLDLHEHCVEEAINLLEMHLKCMLKLCTSQDFTLDITQAVYGGYKVLRYLKETGIGYTEENLGAYLIHRRDIERAEAPVTAGRSSLADFLRAPSY
eukprot:SM000187S03901  [mRNA]  locus=s187:140186:143938:- [translate_table: standard]